MHRTDAEARSRILVADDDEVSRRLVRRSLEPAHEVVEAADGPSALSQIDAAAPDLVLLDVMMPGMSGYDVCREVKARQGDGPILPVILLTGLSDRSERTEGLRAGADEFLAKPWDPTELGLRVETLLRIRRHAVLIQRRIAELTELGALKDDLVSLIAHDLRSPLSGALSLLRLVRDAILDDDLRADLAAAMVATLRATATAEELLEVRLLEEGRLVPDRRPVCARALVHDAVASLEAAARTRRVSFTITAPDEARFDLDVKLVSRALENLLANALRYSPDGGDISVTVRRSSRTLDFEVADRGPGIPASVRNSLFEKFGAVHARRREARRGFGLGLYLVRLVADAHGGRTSVRERPGGGTVFQLCLGRARPRRRVVAAPEARA